MSQIRKALANGMSNEQIRVMNILRGITMASNLDNKDKRLCVDFLNDLEDYLEDSE